MQVTNYSFEDLPFSKLFKTYVHSFDEVSKFFEADPFDREAISQKIDNFAFQGNREQAASILSALNKQFDVHEAAIRNIERLEKENALAVVTGQQLGVYGGPLYTVLKTISTIHIANKLEKEFDRPVIPVFWLADEDHDYDEVRKLTIIEEDESKTFSLPPKNNHLPTVADLSLPDELSDMRDQLKESLYDTDFSNDLWELLDESFKKGHSFYKAFGLFISRLFSKHGLVLAGSNHPDVKAATGQYLKASIDKADKIRDQLEKKSADLAEDYHQQVTLYDSNLFYLGDKTGRTKISRNGNSWKTDGSIEWSTAQLVDEIEAHPDRFSPNVFLRPILQDALLPTIGYVAGPGEAAYYGQMKGMYRCFDMDMPIIFPRMSATLVEPAIDRIIGELPFEFHEYGKRIEDLESDYVDRTDQYDIEAIFEEWQARVEEISDDKKKDIADIDSTLEASAEKATSVYINELNKLKGKVYRSVKKQDQTQLDRIRRIKANLFPGDGLQERTVAGIFFMNKYGIDIWDKLLNSLDPDEEFDHHKLVYL
ncbi:bacillithiol biosynthesis cysteine-adding enzyme BshC [Fodinibius sp.]|uniref:bacillithiol biosynthesis cysteine-adding enzyme BshC n=1 Tax=Fodinibius sp. TaxID=1872440 RepID=UPI002ACDE74D|nr:bacillithiol biosynthesis cysteine-adding enzyme BshC [Fodinibius sp.]MDZ7659227.1 bacillithiol biosynthesis cysteine-adding enzyme BshC [Fodinibius sp.]